MSNLEGTRDSHRHERIFIDSADIARHPLDDCLRDSSSGFLPPLFSLIDALSMGQGIIEGGGRFQPFTYGEIPFPDYALVVRYDGNAKSRPAIVNIRNP